MTTASQHLAANLRCCGWSAGAGVALVAGVGVQRLYSEQLQQAHSQQSGHLRDDHALLQQHVRQLEAQLEDINMRRSGGQQAGVREQCCP